MARLYIDEHMGNFAEHLRNDGHDVLFGVDHGGEGRRDAWHFWQAALAERTLLTFNRGDFQFLHRLWMTLRTWKLAELAHAGVLTATRVLTPLDWFPALRTRLLAPETLRGRMLTWHPENGVWHEDSWKPED